MLIDDDVIDTLSRACIPRQPLLFKEDQKPTTSSEENDDEKIESSVSRSIKCAP